jgi:HNH endonuclease
MRRFLNPSDKIYYPNVWNTLKTSFPEATSFNRMEQIEKFIEALNRGTVAINVNQKDITAENVYHIIANGEYFGKSDDEAVVFLQNLADLPMGQFLLFQFYNYNLGFFQVASMMFDILLEVEKDEQYSNFFQGTATTDKRCIYCLEDTGTFTSEEHIVPESLGNYDTFLPKGFVCDKCNNETLSGLDAALVNSDLLALLKTLYMPYTKAGKLPQAEYKDLSIKKTAPTNIVFTDKSTDGTEKFTLTSREKDGSVKFSMHMKGKKEFDPIILGRALYKIGLGMVAFHQGGKSLLAPQVPPDESEHVTKGGGVLAIPGRHT